MDPRKQIWFIGNMRLSAALLVLVCLMHAASHGAVGINDPCPVPTPHPPSTAGAGVAHNGGMEAGFTNGAANQWIAFKAESYTSQTHVAGTDRPFAGAASQRLDLTQPPGSMTDQSAGLYQQIWVVPGQTYTATVKVYLVPPTQQAYNGEDLVAFIGLDPFGEPSGIGGGSKWSTTVSTPNTWVTATTSVKAVLPVMTLTLRGMRKWPQHGNNSKVWFDEVTLSGPIPQEPRPGPEPLPSDPETLIPQTQGPNLVVNASFEEAYVGGVSANWNKWSTAGTGDWRQSRRVGKVGGGKYDCGNADAMYEMRAKTILLLGGNPNSGANGTYGDSTYLANKYPELENTIFIGRPYIDENWDTYKTNPVFYGAQLADQLRQKQIEWPRIDAWQGYNEPDWGDTWQTVLLFEKAFTERLHYWGMKSCVLNLSTGSPGNIWRMVDETYNPSCRDLLATADYLGHHCYGGPANDLMVTNQIEPDYSCSFALRPRKFADMYARRGWRFPPVITTEGSTWGPWHGSISPSVIGTDLVTMGAFMNANRWWCGYTNFVTGASCSGWKGWDIIGQGTIIPDVGAWNAANPADAMDGLYSQMFGAGQVHPRFSAGLTPAGLFNGGVYQNISGLIAGRTYLIKAWIKWEFRGHQPTQLKFYLGVDPSAQATDGDAAGISWGNDQVADKAPVHEIFSHAWRTFTATGPSAGIWLRASQAIADPSFMFYVDQVEVREAVGITPPTVRSDFDQDGDVDQADFGHLQECFSGAGVAQTLPACADARLDSDDDVDQDDFGIFQSCFSGTNQPVNPSCSSP